MTKDKKFTSIKDKIISCVMIVLICLGLIITGIMVVANLYVVDYTMLDTMQPMARVASQNVSSNLHQLSEQMYRISVDSLLAEYLEEGKEEEIEQFLLERENEIEFVWLGIFRADGSLYLGDENTPASIKGEEYYELIQQTGNRVIGKPYVEDGVIQLVVSVPVTIGEEVEYYAAGSYKYDILNDVLSNINLGETGSTYIIDEEGTIICDRETENIAKSENVFELYDSSSNRELFQQILSGQTGSDTARLDGVSHYIGFSPVTGTNWSLVIDVPKIEFTGKAWTAVIICLVITIISIVIATIFIKRVIVGMTNSLKSATGRLKELAEGNLTREVSVIHTGDEIETLTVALSKTIGSLREYITNIKYVLQELSHGNYTVETDSEFVGDFRALQEALDMIISSLNKNMKAMNDTSIEVSRNTEEVEEYTEQLYQGSDMQIKAIERLDKSMNVIDDHIETIVDSAKKVNESADVTEKKVEQSTREMEDMVQSMNAIDRNMQEIIKISEMIEEISSQTSLLSLNASIEAARAGESGKGFAVVSEQIGILAQQSADASAQTAEIIRNTKESIRQGVDAVHLTAESLHQIKETSDQFTVITESLEKVIDEQHMAVKEVKKEIVSVEQIAENNMSTAENTNSSCKEFLNQAQILKQLVEHVRIKD